MNLRAGPGPFVGDHGEYPDPSRCWLCRDSADAWRGVVLREWELRLLYLGQIAMSRAGAREDMREADLTIRVEFEVAFEAETLLERASRASVRPRSLRGLGPVPVAA